MLHRSTAPGRGPMCRSARARTRSRAGPGRPRPAHGRNWHRLACLPAELRHTRGACLDVVDREIRPRTALARLHVRDRRALLPANLRHVVLERAGVRLELPSEQRAPELLTPLRVVRRNLDVHDLTWQRCLLVSSVTAMPPSALTPPGSRENSGSVAARTPGHPDYFRACDRILRARSRGISGPARSRARYGAGSTTVPVPRRAASRSAGLRVRAGLTERCWRPWPGRCPLRCGAVGWLRRERCWSGTAV